MALQALSRAVNAASRRGFALNSKREFSALLTAAEEYPDIPATSPTPSKAGETSITTLDNGLIIATEDGSATSTVLLSMPTAGSGSEASDEAGAAFANKCFAYKSAGGMSSIAILRALENGGAKPFTSANRYGASVGMTCAPENASALAGAALISSTDSTYEKWDVREAVTTAKAEAAKSSAIPEVALTEAIYAAAYGAQSTLGRPFFSSTTDSALVSFREANYVLEGSVLTATGVDHATFVSDIQTSLGELQGSGKKAPTVPGAPFIGGEYRVSSSAGGAAHVAISLGAATDSPAVLAVLKHCLSLSGVSAFASPGLVGVYGSTSAAEGSALTDSLVAALGGSFSSEVVSKAKTLAKGEALFAMDAGSKALAEVMAASVIATGSFGSKSIASGIDGVSDKDVNDALSSMKKAGVSLAAVGEISYVPYLGSVAGRL